MIDDVKYNDRKYLDRAEQSKEAEKPNPPKKEGKSPFDDLMEQGRRLQQGSVDTRSQDKRVTEQAVREIEKRQERQREQSKDKERDEDGKQDSRGDRQDTQSVTKKVVGKGGSKEQQGGGGSHSSEGGSGFSRKKGSSLESKKSEMTEARMHHAEGAFGKAFKAALEKQAPKTIPQEILNQVVRYVRVGLSREGDKEVELQLHEKIFKGLRLRLSSNRGRVTVHFLAANAETKALFEKESSHIRAHLESKGIAVEKINVT
ncbi:MAG: flagellar hook-length control protein FliK [bacterium]|nr:flagellar hook-length control protein FliK [bacterium]